MPSGPMVIDAVTDAVVFLLLIIAQTEAAVRGATDCPVTPGCGRKTGDERVKKKKKKKKDRCHGLFHSCN